MFRFVSPDNTVDIPYSIGRPDCDSSKGMPTRPLPEHDTLHSIPLLKDMFDLDDEEAVALLGELSRLCNHFLVSILRSRRTPKPPVYIGIMSILDRASDIVTGLLRFGEGVETIYPH